ncbi:MAG TPA: hypothetical protein VGS00_10825, partial [Thermoanaerobaculia bacterium]|nr:hypothetical protein [Thermoanaerobaculia bacterium]
DLPAQGAEVLSSVEVAVRAKLTQWRRDHAAPLGSPAGICPRLPLPATPADGAARAAVPELCASDD